LDKDYQLTRVGSTAEIDSRERDG